MLLILVVEFYEFTSLNLRRVKRGGVKISFVEVQNFRKLKSTHIDFDQTTLFVGANNSGKTSAMLALRYFLLSPTKLSLRDITIANWTKIDEIGRYWEAGEDPSSELRSVFPALDVWMEVPISKIHHVVHILPTINWKGGLIGVRLQYEPGNLEVLRTDYLFERKAAVSAIDALNKGKDKSGKISPPHVWPASLTEFLEKRLAKYFDLNAYALDPALVKPSNNGAAVPQLLSLNATPLDKNPFKSLIKINDIAAQRDFADAGEKGPDDKDNTGSGRFKKRLSEQLRSYYDRHLDLSKTPSVDDLEALGAVQNAECTFDGRLKTAFAEAFQELEELGYPGITNPKIRINSQLRATDGLKHGSAVEYVVADPTGDGTNPLRLPEDYSGLGYQNLISMVFMLMSFREEWMRKGGSASEDSEQEGHIQPLHLVLVEEPEAHLHAQVQQVFISKAYALLRKHKDLGASPVYSTQLVVSTHSSHVTHEADFSTLRYFRRRHALSPGETPTTTVANLSSVFGEGDETHRFVKRYLKATHCDLFFADAAIFVEGQAERILVPHFVRQHFPNLSRRYVTLIDLGGSHAHSFKQLVNELGIATLIIADLDAVTSHKITRGDGVETTVWKAERPKKGLGQKTSNPVLKSWHPSLEMIDDLLDLKPDQHSTLIDKDCGLYVAFQKGVRIKSEAEGDEVMIPRTFEDALIFENKKILETISGSAIACKVQELIAKKLAGEELADELFDILKNAEKAAFALDCLMIKDPKVLQPPTYIREGLEWLQCTLEEKVGEDLASTLAK